MTSQELEMMAATVISPIVDGAYQSGCHTASVWDKKAQENIPRLMNFMSDFGLITARDPKNKYFPMTDVIHKVLNDITINDWAIIIGGDSHTRSPKGLHLVLIQVLLHLHLQLVRQVCLYLNLLRLLLGGK